MADNKPGIPVQQPKPDVYLALLAITFFATLIATAIMWYESTL